MFEPAPQRGPRIVTVHRATSNSQPESLRRIRCKEVLDESAQDAWGGPSQRCTQPPVRLRYYIAQRHQPFQARRRARFERQHGCGEHFTRSNGLELGVGHCRTGGAGDAQAIEMGLDPLVLPGQVAKSDVRSANESVPLLPQSRSFARVLQEHPFENAGRANRLIHLLHRDGANDSEFVIEGETHVEKRVNRRGMGAEPIDRKDHITPHFLERV
jgi:hypothetical protein